ncbi:hypothetical protein BH10PSE19_BH10PSE19_00570 [soil metagenome]
MTNSWNLHIIIPAIPNIPKTHSLLVYHRISSYRDYKNLKSFYSMSVYPMQLKKHISE